MFLAVRDLRHAKGRFSLIVTVVALMTILVGFLTGLTGGLAMQNISSLVKLDADRVVFSVPGDESLSYTRSSVSEAQYDAFAAADGVAAVAPLGISTVLLENGDDSLQVAMLASADGFIPQAPPEGEITIGQQVADDLAVGPGDSINLAGATLVVADVVADEYYSHRDVVWADIQTWRSYLADTRQPDSFATVLVVTGSPDTAALDASNDTVTQPLLQSLLALEAFKSEIGSLALMIGMLVLISVLVIGVFFLVWSMQRHRDIAVLKAIGADTRWLARDALGQAFLVLCLGAGIGILATLGLGFLAAQALPFSINALSILAPPMGMILAGLLGAMVSLKQITKVDPNTALAAATA